MKHTSLTFLSPCSFTRDFIVVSNGDKKKDTFRWVLRDSSSPPLSALKNAEYSSKNYPTMGREVYHDLYSRGIQYGWYDICMIADFKRSYLNGYLFVLQYIWIYFPVCVEVYPIFIQVVVSRMIYRYKQAWPLVCIGCTPFHTDRPASHTHIFISHSSLQSFLFLLLHYYFL